MTYFWQGNQWFLLKTIEKLMIPWPEVGYWFQFSEKITVSDLGRGYSSTSVNISLTISGIYWKSMIFQLEVGYWFQFSEKITVSDLESELLFDFNAYFTEIRRKNFLWFRRTLFEPNLCIAIGWEKIFFDLKKFFDCFFSLNLRNEYLCSHKSTCVMWSREIFSLIKKKLSFLKLMKFNKVFLKFSPVLYLNQINVFLNQINNVKKIISFI